MSQIPIPNDWDGVSWRCVQVQWPDSDQYIGILHGLLSYLMRGRLYDARSGSILDAQAVGQQIWDRDTPLVDCAGELVPGAGVTPTASGAGWGTCWGNCEDEMPCINVSALLKIENGILYARDDCCQWIAVGAIGAGVPGDLGDAPFEIPNVPDPTYSGCGKAIAVIEAIWRVGDAGLDNVNTLPFLYEAAVQQQSGININSIAALSMQLIALEFEFGWTPQVFDPQIKQEWICTLERWFEDDANGMNAETVAAFKRHILASDWANIVDRVLATAYWGYVVDAIGNENLNNIAKLGATNTTGDCDCPEQSVPLPFPIGEMIYDVIANMSAVSEICTRTDETFSATSTPGSQIRGDGDTNSDPGGLCQMDVIDNPGIEILAGDEVWATCEVYDKGPTSSFNSQIGFTQQRIGGDTEILTTYGDAGTPFTNVEAVPGTWSKLWIFGGDPATLSRVYNEFQWYADGEVIDFTITGLVIRRP